MIVRVTPQLIALWGAAMILSWLTGCLPFFLAVFVVTVVDLCYTLNMAGKPVSGISAWDIPNNVLWLSCAAALVWQAIKHLG